MQTSTLDQGDQVENIEIATKDTKMENPVRELHFKVSFHVGGNNFFMKRISAVESLVELQRECKEVFEVVLKERGFIVQYYSVCDKKWITFTEKNFEKSKNEVRVIVDGQNIPDSEAWRSIFTNEIQERLKREKEDQRDVHRRESEMTSLLEDSFDIKQIQKAGDLLIGKRPFIRLVREIVDEFSPGIRFQSNALIALQRATEEYITDIFVCANLSAFRAKRVTISVKDIQFAKRVLQERTTKKKNDNDEKIEMK